MRSGAVSIMARKGKAVPAAPPQADRRPMPVPKMVTARKAPPPPVAPNPPAIDPFTPSAHMPGSQQEPLVYLDQHSQIESFSPKFQSFLCQGHMSQIASFFGFIGWGCSCLVNQHGQNQSRLFRCCQSPTPINDNNNAYY